MAAVVGTECHGGPTTVERRRWSVSFARLACPDGAIRVIYFDLVYQWRQIAEELEAIERHQSRSATDCYD